MFKHDAVVEEIRPETSGTSFQVIDVANPSGLLQPATREGWVEACNWGSSCGGCSQSGTCTGGSSCVGCSNTFSNPHYNSNEKLTEKDLLQAIIG